MRVQATSSAGAGAGAASTAAATFPGEMRRACEAVQLASKLCVATQLVLQSNEKVSKQDDSPVTIADFAAQAVVSYWLQQEFPGIALVAEESAECLRDGAEGAALLWRVTDLVNQVLADAPGGGGSGPLSSAVVADLVDRGASQGGRTGAHWILDPIDGTKGFINGRQYAIALALMEDGVLKVGAMGCPNMPKMGEGSCCAFPKSRTTVYGPYVTSTAVIKRSTTYSTSALFYL